MPNNDPVFAPDGLLCRLAEAYGTPLQVYDRATLEQQTGKIFQAFAWNSGFRQYFPIWLCSNPQVLSVILSAGCGLLCSSAAQFRLAALAGAAGDQLLFFSTAPQPADWQAALGAGAVIVLDSPEQLAQVPVQAYGSRVLGLGVRPNKGYTMPGIRQTAMLYKFGMTPDAVVSTAAQAARRGFTHFGLYMQVNANGATPGYFPGAARFLAKLAEEVYRRTHRPLAWCNLSGGLNERIDLAAEASGVRRTLRESGFPEMGIHTALGRFLIAPAGITLARVLGIKTQERNLAVLDVSMAHLPRLMLPGARYSATVLGKHGQTDWENYLLSGPLMDKLDTFSGRYILPRMRTGDILALHDTGACCRAMASNYGGICRCPEVLLDWDGPRLICSGETQAQWLSGFPPEGK